MLLISPRKVTLVRQMSGIYIKIYKKKTNNNICLQACRNQIRLLLCCSRKQDKKEWV